MCVTGCEVIVLLSRNFSVKGTPHPPTVANYSTYLFIGVKDGSEIIEIQTTYYNGGVRGASRPNLVGTVYSFIRKSNEFTLIILVFLIVQILYLSLIYKNKFHLKNYSHPIPLYSYRSAVFCSTEYTPFALVSYKCSNQLC